MFVSTVILLDTTISSILFSLRPTFCLISRELMSHLDKVEVLWVGLIPTQPNWDKDNDSAAVQWDGGWDLAVQWDGGWALAVHW